MRDAFERFELCSEERQGERKKHTHLKEREKYSGGGLSAIAGGVLMSMLSLLLLLLSLHVFTHKHRGLGECVRVYIARERKVKKAVTANIYVYCSTRESVDRGQSNILDPVWN